MEKPENEVIIDLLVEDSKSLQRVVDMHGVDHGLSYAKKVRDSIDLFIRDELRPTAHSGSELLRSELPKWKKKLLEINGFIKNLEDTSDLSS